MDRFEDSIKLGTLPIFFPSTKGGFNGFNEAAATDNEDPGRGLANPSRRAHYNQLYWYPDSLVAKSLNARVQGSRNIYHVMNPSR